MRPQGKPVQQPGKPEEQSFPSAPQLGWTPVLGYPLVPAQLQSPGGTRGPGAGPAHGQARWAAGGETKAPRGPGGDLQNNARAQQLHSAEEGLSQPPDGIGAVPGMGGWPRRGLCPQARLSACHPSPSSLAASRPQGCARQLLPAPLVPRPPGHTHGCAESVTPRRTM